MPEPVPIETITALQIRENEAIWGEEILAAEAPLQIRINGKPFVVTMRTPGDDAALALGFLFGEGHIPEPGLRRTKTTLSQQEGVDHLDLCVPPEYICENLNMNRNAVSYASCGICGREGFQPPTEPVLPPSRAIPYALLDKMFLALRERQPLYAQSGGSHGAGLFSATGICLTAFEDIGRHNAVDKCVGALILADQLKDAHCLLVSGRISYEIIIKAYYAACPIVGAISAPSSLAVSLADKLGVTVIGFCRDARATLYTHQNRIHLEGSPVV